MKKIDEEASSISEDLRSSISEIDLVNKKLNLIASLIDSTNNGPLGSLTGQDFASFAGINWGGATSSTSVKSNGKIKSLDDISDVTRQFFSTNGFNVNNLDSNLVKKFNQYISADQYDPTEKVVVAASVDKVARMIKETFHGNKAIVIGNDFAAKFLRDGKANIDIFSNIQTLTTWKHELHAFMNERNFTDVQMNEIFDSDLTNEDFNKSLKKV